MHTAFALAGLGGFNAHGAGFLAAATKWGVEPELITATSGQILVLADWLATGNPCAHLSFAEPGVDAAAAQLKIAVSGYPGVFRPAFPEALFRFVSPNVHGDLRDRLADLFLPAQQYVPQRTEADFEGIAATLNGSRIGVVFNTLIRNRGPASSTATTPPARSCRSRKPCPTRMPQGCGSPRTGTICATCPSTKANERFTRSRWKP
jgi:hypothetical protein